MPTLPSRTPAPSSLSCADTGRAPLPGREEEFDAVLRFMQSWLTGQQRKLLFVYGACGCGKTSTVLRTLRSVQDKPLPCDAQRCAPRKGDERQAAATAALALPSLVSPAWTAACTSTEPDLAVRDTTKHKRARSSSSAGRVKSARTETQPSRTEYTVESDSDERSGGRITASTSARTSGGHVTSTRSSECAAGAAGERSPPSTTDTSPTVARQSTSSTSSSSSSSSSGGGSSVQTTTSAAAAGRVPTSPPLYSQAYFYAQYPLLYGANRSPVQGHYVNCTDLSAKQLASAVHHSLRTVYHRPNAPMTALMQQVLAVATSGAPSGRATRSSTSECQPAAGCTGRGKSVTVPLQVVVLDEVEYVRQDAHAALFRLVELSVQSSSRIAFVFISNQRDVRLVPQMLLEELPFCAYTEPQLCAICRAVAQQEVQRQRNAHAATGSARSSSRSVKARAAAVADTPDFSISPSLYTYIARKALLEHSGDVRQVMAMCRHAIDAAYAEWRAAHRSGPSCASTSRRAASEHALRTTLETAVDAFSARTVTATAAPKPTAAPSPASGLQSRPPTCAVTLGNSVKAIRANAVEDHLPQHISTMPEHTIYVLCCLVVQALQAERTRRSAAVAVNGVLPGQRGRPPSASKSSPHAVIGSTIMTRRATHALYTTVMISRHFPRMNDSGLSSALSCLADLGILTRPQRRGNEEVFSFSGAWPLPAMERSIIERGEVLRREREEVGLDDSENRYAALLQELKHRAGLTM